jgi:hypothetical protein
MSVSSKLEINLPAGSYDLTWVDTKTTVEKKENVKNQPAGWMTITSPAFTEDIALRLEKVK